DRLLATRLLATRLLAARLGGAPGFRRRAFVALRARFALLAVAPCAAAALLPADSLALFGIAILGGYCRGGRRGRDERGGKSESVESHNTARYGKELASENRPFF